MAFYTLRNRGSLSVRICIDEVPTTDNTFFLAPRGTLRLDLTDVQLLRIRTTYGSRVLVEGGLPGIVQPVTPLTPVSSAGIVTVNHDPFAEGELYPYLQNLKVGVYLLQTVAHGFELVFKTKFVENADVYKYSRYLADGTSKAWNGTIWASVITSGSTGTGGDIVYTVNNIGPDDAGNFSIALDTLGGAPTVHQHEIADVTDLQTALDSKSNVSHVHPFVQNLTVNGNTFTGSVNIQTKGDLSATASGQVVTLTAELPAVAAATEIQTAGVGIQTFVGTQAQWAAHTKTAGVTYIAYIHE